MGIQVFKKSKTLGEIHGFGGAGRSLSRGRGDLAEK